MGQFTVVYRGPSIDENPERARRLAERIAADLPMSAAEALRRLERTPFALRSGLSEEEALGIRRRLSEAGAEVEVIPAKAETGTPPGEKALEVAEPQRLYIRGALRALMLALSSGLLLAAAIIVAGAALILLAGPLAGEDGSPYLFTAAGWVTVALGLFVVVATAALRARTLLQIVAPPDLSTPLKTLQSFLRAVNDRNWPKALRCLAARPGSIDLGARSPEKAFLYFRQLAREVVLPRRIDPATVTVLHTDGDTVELCFHLNLIWRQPTGDGSRLRRVLVDARRFQRGDGGWFLVDACAFGQQRPELLPLPGCRECGSRCELGRNRCGACGSRVPPLALAEEEWLPARRKPDLAALLSALVPGLGQAYNGQTLKGLLIASTCWMVLPWAFGVVDAIRVAERINRNESFHDLPSRPLVPILAHLAALLVAAALVLAFGRELPLLRELLATPPAPAQSERPETESRFRSSDGSFSVLLPRRWEVAEEEEGGLPVMRATSEDGDSTLMISTQPLPDWWEPCPQALAARDQLQADGAEVANVDCGLSDGHRRFRVDSYSPDRGWRRSFIAIAAEGKLIVVAFACRAERQDRMVPLFDAIIGTLEIPTGSEVEME